MTNPHIENCGSGNINLAAHRKQACSYVAKVNMSYVDVTYWPHIGKTNKFSVHMPLILLPYMN